MKIVLLESLGVPQEQIDGHRARLEAMGHSFEAFEKNADPAVQRERSRGADVIMLANMPLDASVVRESENLKLIDVAFTGVDHIPVQEAREKRNCRLQCVRLRDAGRGRALREPDDRSAAPCAGDAGAVPQPEDEGRADRLSPVRKDGGDRGSRRDREAGGRALCGVWLPCDCVQPEPRHGRGDKRTGKPGGASGPRGHCHAALPADGRDAAHDRGRAAGADEAGRDPDQYGAGAASWTRRRSLRRCGRGRSRGPPATYLTRSRRLMRASRCCTARTRS